MNRQAAQDRYENMPYRRAGKSGIKLPPISLGFWYNFSQERPLELSKEMVFTAFDRGITYFDLANNYGPPYGDAELTFGKIISSDLKPYRDEIIISTKAGYNMWDGPYGEWGSRKYLLSSLDQSLKRMQLDYVDIFYSHRYDPETPLEETMGALDSAVKSGKALYASLSNYPPKALKEALAILRELRTPCILHQVKYSLLKREIEDELLDVHKEEGIGCVSFSPLSRGVLSDKYLSNLPSGSQPALEQCLQTLSKIAHQRGQTLSQMALAWQLYDDRITSVIIGASSPEQIKENVKCLENTSFSAEELAALSAVNLGLDHI